jgi:hypothetical protein
MNASSYLQSVDWNYYLGFGLLMFIIALIIGFGFINDPNDLQTFAKFMIYAIYVLFVLLLMSNHNDLIEHSKMCKVPVYPLESIGFIYKLRRVFIDFIIMIWDGTIFSRKPVPIMTEAQSSSPTAK